MKKRTWLAVVASVGVLFAGIAQLNAQDASEPQAVGETEAAVPASEGAATFAPFPSRLRAAMRDGKVELSWIDSPDVAGSYAVYRQIELPSSATFGTAVKLGSVGRGVQSFTDIPPNEADYYYLVLALADDGSPYEAFVPGGNATAASISLKPATIADTAAVGMAPKAGPVAEKTEKTVAPSGPIDGLSAKARSDSVILSYPANPGVRLVVYRGTSPIERSSDLLDASLVATFIDKDGTFVDFPVPGIDYWYALLGEEDVKAGRIKLSKGRNATIDAVRIATTKRTEAMAEFSPLSRTPPLPAILLDSAAGTALPASPIELPVRRELSQDTEKALGAIMSLAPSIQRPLPPMRLLPEELAAPSGGEDYALSLIVTDKLVKRDWATAIDQLRKYLSLNRSATASARARFYLGQALVFSGSYRDAFFEFLTAKAFFPTESAPWIDYVLAVLRRG
jgi:hypothetical protein